jgi:DNA cross-link repair 1A protein
MPIEMPKGLPFAVDTWSSESGGKRYHFLSHAHRDHLAGIESRASYPIYATRVTAAIVLNYFPQVVLLFRSYL